MTLAKICGVTTPEAVRAALDGGAAFIGLVVFARSPRAISPAAAGALLEKTGLARREGRAARVVAVTVDADDALLADLRERVAPDLVQLHGAETPERAARARAITGAGIIRALGVSGPDDLAAAAQWDEAADHMLFDAKAPAGSHRPGGYGAAFDWGVLDGMRPARPWFLAGGLDAGNVAEAARRTGAPMVDVSSGVESAPGVKDPARITAFLQALKRP